MHSKIATTVTVFALAGAATVTAFVLAQTRTSQDKAVDEMAISMCGLSGPPKATAKLLHGTFSGALSSSSVLKGNGELAAQLQITTDEVGGPRPALDLAFVIDHSGSMAGRIEHAANAASAIVDRLGPQDHASLIQYDDTADVMVSSIAMDAAGKAKMHAAIERLAPAGGTNLEGGLVAGRVEVERAHHDGDVNRVILLSDGRANVGITDPKAIADTARDAANHGVRITAMGIGVDFNEDLMEAIAEAGRGNYEYVKDAGDLEKAVAGELASFQSTVATNVELRLRPECSGAQIVSVHGYDSQRDHDTVVVPMIDLFGGDARKLLVSLQVPTGHVGVAGALHAELSYRDARTGERKTHAIDLGTQVTEDPRVAAAGVDQDVMAQVLQLQAAESLRQAARAYDAGDRDQAVQILERSSQEISKKGAMYKIAPAKTAKPMADLDDMTKSAKAYAPGTYEGKNMVKAGKQKARVMSKK